MYSLFIAIFVGLGVWAAIAGLRQRRHVLLAVGILWAAGAAFLPWVMGFWGEMLWFEALGFGERFWDAFIVQVSAGAVGMVLAAVFVFSLTIGYSKEKTLIRLAALAIAALGGAAWGAMSWETILRFVHAAPTELRDPIFERPVGFYLFVLPMADRALTFLLILALLTLAACALDAFAGQQDDGSISILPQGAENRVAAVYRAAGILLLVMALGKYLDRFHLMYSRTGVVAGPGWTDVHIRIPALYAMIVVMALAGVLLLAAPLRRRLIARFQGRHLMHAHLFGATALTVLALQLLLLNGVPTLFQSLRVEPNEITLEAPYIANNIRFTRRAFRLHTVEEREYPATGKFTAETVAANPAVFANIRLWDYRALDAVYKQFQEIRLYYEFNDVDVDRYTIGNDYRQVMVSAREMELNNLPDQSQTFVNRRFKYTHGYGITMTNVSEFTPQGLPDLLIRDIPPKHRYPGIAVERPEIYYGELTRTPVIVNTREPEFDYPRGNENATIHYPGAGGVKLENLWRKLLYGWKFDGLQLLLSDYPTRESRIMFHRQIDARVKLLAPFLEFDDDPYIVLDDGRLYWIVDAYTTSAFFPYSEPFGAEAGWGAGQERQPPYAPSISDRFRGKNYVRNAVKAVVDAFDGSVVFYIFDPDEPVIRTWQRIFPELFKEKEEMPAALRTHVRYPADMLLLQGLVYAKYHMTDPTVFYNQEDLWVRATEKYYQQVQPVAPYYIMWELPESDRPEFVLMLPFTPKNRQVSIGWIAGMCDGDNYGRFLAYLFPKEKRILGPQQVETKIDQDRFLSGQLTLWDQRGSRVIRGNVLAIPVEETLFYVEPIYLQAETAAYPELRLVALMYDDQLSYAETFDQALQGLLDGQAAGSEAARVDGTRSDDPGAATELVRQAADAFDGYLNALGEKRYQDASGALKHLESALQALSRQLSGGTPGHTRPTDGGDPQSE